MPRVIDEAKFETYMEDLASKSILLYSIRNTIERVSLVNARYKCKSGDVVPKPMTQVALIKFVRNCQKLRWIRSYLTQQNVSMLQNERPDVTFVSSCGNVL